MNRMHVIAALVAAAPQVAAVQAADLAAGQAIAEAYCARCHAIGREGASPFPPAPPFRLIPERYDPQDLAEALAEGMVVGHDAMPEFELPPERISHLLAYIASLKSRN
jgi:mono/diheme cytochrome c family protein